jgi:DNA recombination protein RmuC
MDIGVILACAAMAVALALCMLLVMRQRAVWRGLDPALESRLRELTAAQNEIAGRFSEAIMAQSHHYGDLQRNLTQRLENMDQRLGVNLKENAETLGGLRERLTVIDEAQKNLTDISGQVVSLQQILANKQSRGAFGQAQMENIVRDALPNGLYEFQATLSNKSRPDCVINLPNGAARLVIDSKFPLECFEVLKNATNDTERKAAGARIKSDVGKHVKDIAEKYLIAGETQDPAIMFVPSESLYAELHDSFPDLIQTAYRSRVVVVSPNILMLAINTVQTVLKDARMREQASLIQREVQLLLRDVTLLTDRVGKLQTHFGQVDSDIKQIMISAEKIAGRADRIEKVEVGGTDAAIESAAKPTLFSAVGNG